MITVQITMDDGYSTQFNVDNVNEIEDKVKEWHIMSDFARVHYEKKGTLEAELATGWYYRVST